MEFCRIKRNQWSDEREMLKGVSFKASKNVPRIACDSAQLKYRVENERKGEWLER